MQSRKIAINDTAYVTSYLLESKISMNTYKNRPALIICPGGSYLFKATKEGEPVAIEFLSRGYNAFVLNYSTLFPDRESFVNREGQNHHAVYPRQVVELMETISLVKRNSDTWGIDKNKIFVLGFSAGGHIAGSAGVHWKNGEILQHLSFTPQAQEVRPTGVILCYPMLNGNILKYLRTNENKEIADQYSYTSLAIHGTDTPEETVINDLDLRQFITPDTPPTFVWHTVEDMITKAADTTSFVEKLLQENVSCEYHLFTKGKHGMGLCNAVAAKNQSDINLSCAQWITLADLWMKGIIYE